jgi:biotin carboxyl carrier protein
MIFIPYPLRMEAKGQLLPIQREWLFSQTMSQTAQVKEIRDFVKTGRPVSKGQELIRMYERELAQKLSDLNLEIEKADDMIREFSKNLKDQDQNKGSLAQQLAEARATKNNKQRELRKLVADYNADIHNPGEFTLKAPISGIVLSSDFREKLLGNSVKPSDPLLRFGKVDIHKPKLEEWEIELKIPQKHVGQILSAFNTLKTKELDVDILLVSRPTQTFKGKLARSKVAFEATPNQTDNNEPDPVVLAWVRVSGNDIPKEYQLPPELMLTGTEVHTRVRCGNHAMGYSLFYGVWEFLYEKVVFFF